MNLRFGLGMGEVARSAGEGGCIDVKRNNPPDTYGATPL